MPDARKTLRRASSEFLYLTASVTSVVFHCILVCQHARVKRTRNQCDKRQEQRATRATGANSGAPAKRREVRKGARGRKSAAEARRAQSCLFSHRVFSPIVSFLPSCLFSHLVVPPTSLAAAFPGYLGHDVRVGDDGRARLGDGAHDKELERGEPRLGVVCPCARLHER